MRKYEHSSVFTLSSVIPAAFFVFAKSLVDSILPPGVVGASLSVLGSFVDLCLHRSGVIHVLKIFYLKDGENVIRPLVQIVNFYVSSFSQDVTLFSRSVDASLFD